MKKKREPAVCPKCGRDMILYPAFSMGAATNQDYGLYKFICLKCRFLGKNVRYNDKTKDKYIFHERAIL